MREALTEYENQLVLCKGWIDTWKDFEGSEIRQVCVKQPTIKVANKNLLFAEQEVISTEHHINLFIPFEDLSEYRAQFQQHRTISFSGVVKRYTRKNGTTDYGIAATLNTTYTLISSASCLPCLLGFPQQHTKFPSTPISTHSSTTTAGAGTTVGKAGNALPTFEYNYGTYKELIVGMKRR